MVNPPTFDQFAGFIREWAGLARTTSINPASLFEEDLGITGDDGRELLTATEARFGVSLSSDEDGYRRRFDLGPNEFLFHSEGSGFDLQALLGADPTTVRAFTVGDLYRAVQRAEEPISGDAGAGGCGT